MSWLSAVALMAVATVATILALGVVAVSALVIREGISLAYRAVVRRSDAPKLANQG